MDFRVGCSWVGEGMVFSSFRSFFFSGGWVWVRGEGAEVFGRSTGGDRVIGRVRDVGFNRGELKL